MSLVCPHCDAAVFRAQTDKLKARTSMLVIHKSGAVEINCEHCKQGVVLPLSVVEGAFALKKAQTPKLIILNPLTDTKRAGHK